MGGNRKSKGQQQHNRRGSSSAGLTKGLGDHAYDGHGSAHHDDFDKVFQDVEATYHVSWKEICFLLSAFLLVACLVVSSAFVSGIIISIHFYDNTGAAMSEIDTSSDDSFLYNAPPYMKVTTLDPTIASSNILQRERDGFDLGKVVTSTASGQLNLLMVVEEVDPLHPGSISDNAEAKVSGYLSDEDCKTDTCRFFTRKGSHHMSRKLKPLVNVRAPKIQPSLCPDKDTVGFNDWNTFKAAVQEANSISAEKFMKWNEYFAKYGATNVYFEDDSYYYEDDVVFTICPGAVLKARKGPIFINAENLLIQCRDCVIDGRGTHLTFGPHAKNILVRGVTFRNSQTSSLTFFHDGAEASFEDCRWLRNSGMDGQNGAVADVNSTSTVNFYRCEVGYGTKAQPSLASSLSVRPNARGEK